MNQQIADTKLMSIEQSLSVRPRPPSGTYIPRPISGTSRRASSTINLPPEQQRMSSSKRERLLSPYREYQTSQLQHKSYDAKHGMPPNSFLLPRASLPQPCLQSQYTNQPKIGFRDWEKSKCTRTPSKDHSDASEHILRPSMGAPAPSQQQLSMPLRVFSHEVTPRALMRPIQPSLPKSQTTSSLTCLISDQDVSLFKPPRRSCFEDTSTDKSVGQQDTIDTVVEDQRLNQNPKTLNSIYEKTNTKHRRHISSQHDSTAGKGALPHHTSTLNSVSTATSTTCNTAVTMNLSINDEVNARRLEEQRRDSNSRRPLFVNTTLANTARIHGSSPLPYLTPHSGTTCVTASSEPSLEELRNVYQAESTSFWAGRYLVTADRVRNIDCQSLLRPKADDIKPLNINSVEFEQQFDKLDESRMARVLDEIREHCKTQAAIKSFNQFEIQFRKRLANPQAKFVRSYSDVFLKHSKASHLETLSHMEVTGIRQYSGNNATSQLSTLNAQATIDKITGLVSQRPGLSKSQTTGDLKLTAVSERAPTPGVRRVPGRHADTACSPQVRKKTQVQPISEIRLRAVEEREAQPRVVMRSNQIDEPVFQLKNARPRKAGNKPSSKAHYDEWPLRSQSRATNPQPTTDDIVERVPAAAASRGRDDPNIAPTSTQNGLSGIADEGVIRENVLYSKKRRDRQISGQRSSEIVKKVVGVGIREVRKMSRRVGSMGWGGTYDDSSPGSQPRIG